MSACSPSAGSPPQPVDAVVASNSYLDKGNQCLGQGKYECAIENYSTAVRVNPRSGDALTNLAWVFATAPDVKYRNGARAVALADSAVHIATRDGTRLDNLGYEVALAAGYAETGAYAEAVRIMKDVINVARQAGHEQQYLDLYQKELDSFLAQRPWRYYPQ
jgi:tetratricopeptide (TPR) repeat protein